MNIRPSQSNSSLSENLFYAGVLAFAATLPLAFFILNNIAAIVIVISWLWLLAQGKVRIRPAKSAYFFIFISLFIIYAVGVVYSTNIKEAFRQLEIMLLLLILPLVLGSVPPISKRKIMSIFLVFAVTSTLIALLCIVETLLRNYRLGFEFATHNAWYYSSEGLVQGFGFHPNYMAIYSLFTILILIQYIPFLYTPKRKYIIILVVVTICLHIAFIAALSARTQIFILLILVPLWILYYTLKYRRFKTGILLLVLCTGLISTSIMVSPILKEKFKGLLNIDVDQDNEKFSASLRIQKWRSAYNIFKENPIIGVGTGDMQDRLQIEYYNNNYEIPYTLRYTAHNQYLDTAARLGIIGLLSLIACLLYPMVRSVKTKDILYFSFLLIIFISLIPEMVLTLNKGVAFYAFFNSIMAFHSDNFSNDAPPIH
ncbi:O-antigen ligase family protein [Pontibacter sp. BT731]|uniref:O-antigen ligase family protein n=1 Tax=Pontibacter coccineus TaxID=3063328 RepID=UPI0026E25BCE|nr:O-antigen ligase family protein [Pontibacter sp. BT731]MDO6391140.1 O-antigen ligase family protein [Pontibacter sp. BT731]